VHGKLSDWNDSNSYGVTHVKGAEPQIEYTFGNTQFGRKYYSEFLGLKAKAKPGRKKTVLGKKERPKSKTKRKKSA